MKNHMKRTGFTLPELLTALVCVGILLLLIDTGFFKRRFEGTGETNELFE